MKLSEELRSKKSRDNRELLDRAADRIDELEAALGKQSEGEWRIVSDYADSRIVECSNCDKQFYFKKKGQLNIDRMPYCPNCGAHMKGGK